MDDPTAFDAHVASISKQFETVASAPIPFVVLLALLAAVIWRILDHHYSGRMLAKDDLLALRDAQLQDSKDKQDGATPDETKAHIAAFQTQLQKIKPRHITKAQRAKLAGALSPFAGQRVTVRSDSSVPDAMALSIAIYDAMEKDGWGMSSSRGSHFSDEMPSRSGLVIVVPSPANLRGQDAALVNELRAFGLELELQAGASEEVEVNITRPDEDA